MRVLKVADLHLTTHPYDEYRWEFFDWLEELVKEHKIDRIDILGDLTDKKDRHPSLLVNRVVNRLMLLAESCRDGIYVLAGNHDYIEKGSPFFRFISQIPKLKFIDVPYIQDNELFLPSTKTSIEDWALLKLSQFSYVNMHQCLKGMKMNSGHVMDKGLGIDYFKNCKRVLSGDIHCSQKLNNIEYVGAPYHIRFGDNYEGRVILREDKGGKVSEQSISVPSIKKLQFEVYAPYKEGYFDQFQIRPNDQVKLVVRLNDSEMYMWKEIKSAIKSDLLAKGVVIRSFAFQKSGHNRVARVRTNKKSNLLTTEDIFNQYVKSESLDREVADFGLRLLAEEEAASCAGE